MSDIINYCPECRAEYREGFVVCADCDVSLVRRLDAETGDRLVPIARETSFEFAGELVDRLEKEEIPYVIQAGTALQLLDGASDGAAEPRPWEARIWVPASRQSRAARVYDEVASERRQERGTDVVNRYLGFTNS